MHRCAEKVPPRAVRELSASQVALKYVEKIESLGKHVLFTDPLAQKLVVPQISTAFK